MLTGATSPVKRISSSVSHLQYDVRYATDSDSHRRSHPDCWTALALAFQARSRPFAGRHSHRNRKRIFLLSDHDLHHHLYRRVDCHLVYPPLGRSFIRHQFAAHDVLVQHAWNQRARPLFDPDFQLPVFQSDDRDHVVQAISDAGTARSRSSRTLLDLNGYRTLARPARGPRGSGAQGRIKKRLTP